jgi:molybdopterin-guanine dinucleotide biosynthesis protein A
MRRQRLAVYVQFDALEHESAADVRSSYSGRAAIVVYEFDDEPKVGNRRTIHPLTIHRVFRNEYGEYFLFISGDPPYVTHLSRERAVNALREDKDAFVREFGDGS